MLSIVAPTALPQPVTAGQLFHGELLDVHAPNSTGWKLVSSSNSALSFGRDGSSSNESYAANAGLFALGSTKNKEEFVALIKKSIEADSPPDRFKTIESNYEYTEQRGYPCVKFSAVVEDTKRKPSFFSKSGLKLQIVSLYCRHPKNPSAGFVAAFSHRGTELDPNLKSSALAFIESVQVPAK